MSIELDMQFAELTDFLTKHFEMLRLATGWTLEPSIWPREEASAADGSASGK